MKRLFYVISLVGIMMLLPTLLIGQILDPEIYSYVPFPTENEPFVDTTYRGLYESRNGRYHSPPDMTTTQQTRGAEQEIENALVGTLAWNAWRDKIKGMYNNPTEVHLNSVFRYWNTQTDNQAVSPPIEFEDTPPVN